VSHSRPELRATLGAYGRRFFVSEHLRVAANKLAVVCVALFASPPLRFVWMRRK